MPGAGNGARTAGADGEGDPTLHIDISAAREELEGLVDATPGPVGQTVGETPELTWAHRSWVARPRMWRWGKDREGQFREHVGEIQP